MIHILDNLNKSNSVLCSVSVYFIRNYMYTLTWVSLIFSVLCQDGCVARNILQDNEILS
jgi:hypothetical protein